jgi:HlyD family secretion protein
MKMKTWSLIGAAAASGALLLAWAFAPRPIEVEVAEASSGPFEVTIDEEGKTRLTERYVVSAPLAGRLARITLREGDAVAADSVVATLTPVLSPLLDERTTRELSARIEAAQANLQRAVLRIERAKVAQQQAQNDLERSEQLARQGFVAPTKLDNDRLAVSAAQKEVAAATEERHVAGHEIEVARAALSASRPGTGAGAARPFAVRSPVSGRVLRVPQASEATVSVGTALLEIGDTSRLEVVAELLTTDALQALPGSRVRIERWGGPGTLEGRVRRVEPAAFTKISALGVEEQRVNVLIDLTSPTEQWKALGDGYRVSVRIVTLAEPKVLRVPVSAVFPRRDGGAAVFVLDGNRARLTPVDIGARNGGAAWVRQGLAEGARVIVYPPAGVSDGVRVKPRAV